ncbi:MAG: hypothetical protein IPJ65_34665 [Archangiaceae bacterium]|nr:hypothetical protein [Archangiaceae bacterium]
MNKSTLVSVLCLGVAIGACAREAVRAAVPAAAHAQGGKKYMVVGASMSAGGYEEDLNKYTAEGWRYVGPLPAGNANPALVFER